MMKGRNLAPRIATGTRWCLARGAAGIALLHHYRARTGSGTWATAHEWAVAATRDPITTHPDDTSLYSGPAAIAYVLHSADHTAYTQALATLDQHITAAVRQRLEAAHERIERGALPALREFDLISGLTGLGVYLLHRRSDDELLRSVLTYLVRLTRPITIHGHVLPGWWTGHDRSDQQSSSEPGGHGNFGMAHGITGPLALLSVTMRRGITVPGHADAIIDICSHLDRWRCGTPRHPWWPETISLQEWQSGTVRRHFPHRPSWCYGIPGQARALQLAALALGDRHRQQAAEHALDACLTDERQLGQLTDASLCHGWAGLLQSTWRAAADAQIDLARHIPRLRQRLVGYLREHGAPATDGFLEGQSGIDLVMDATSTTASSAPDWDACLLIT